MGEGKGMQEVGAFEAKNRLGQLLDLVARGEEIIITRHGKAVARLVPPQRALNRDQAGAAIRRIRKRAEKLRLRPFEWAEWKSYRDEGRP
jgi:prevent-host-death family protein